MWSLEKLSHFKKLQIQVRGGNEASLEEVCHWGHVVKSTARPSSCSALWLPIFEHFPQPHESSVMPLPCLGSQGNGTAHHGLRTLKVSQRSLLLFSRAVCNSNGRLAATTQNSSVSSSFWICWHSLA